MTKRHFIHCTLAALALSALTPAAWAQSYPTKAIRLVVPFPAGGATDLFARSLSQKLGEKVYADMQAQQAAAGAGAAPGAEAQAKPADDNVVDAEVKEVKKG